MCLLVTVTWPHAGSSGECHTALSPPPAAISRVSSSPRRAVNYVPSQRPAAALFLLVTIYFVSECA